LLPILKEAHANKTTDFVLTHQGSIRKTWETFIKTTPYTTTPHDLRRSFASIAVSNGVSFEDVAEVLCDSVETVRRHYGHLDPRAKLRAVNHRRF
jgi:integrase